MNDLSVQKDLFSLADRFGLTDQVNLEPAQFGHTNHLSSSGRIHLDKHVCLADAVEFDRFK